MRLFILNNLFPTNKLLSLLIVNFDTSNNILDEEFDQFLPSVNGFGRRTRRCYQAVYEIFAPRDASQPLGVYWLDENGTYFEMQEFCERIGYDAEANIEYRRSRGEMDAEIFGVYLAVSEARKKMQKKKEEKGIWMFSYSVREQY